MKIIFNGRRPAGSIVEEALNEYLESKTSEIPKLFVRKKGVVPLLLMRSKYVVKNMQK
jgi:inorganic pyrophosphatase/exopolyphosphatase